MSAKPLEREFPVSHTQRVIFARNVFKKGDKVLRNLVAGARENGRPVRVLVILDSHVAEANPDLVKNIRAYAAAHKDVMTLADDVLTVPGGEVCKNDFAYVEQCWRAMHDAALDRHSFVFVIGGGAVLDLGCFAAATAHRGIRHVRFPTTTLSQGDGGVGVKNGVNYFGKKNWIGTFSVPYAIVNDFAFLDTLPPREKRCGLVEAIKVALIRDKDFYHWLEDRAEELAALDTATVEATVRRSAELHVEHIVTNGDPFERGSARPLDYGHWSAHKLEQVSQFAISHGEAVAIGIAVDVFYTMQAGQLDPETAMRIVEFIERVGFSIYSPELHTRTSAGSLVVLEGLEEFREHLGGELTITLVPEIGRKIEVHTMNHDGLIAAIDALAERSGAALRTAPMLESLV